MRKSAVRDHDSLPSQRKFAIEDLKELAADRYRMDYQGAWQAGLAVKPLDLHLVNVGSVPTGPTHGEECLQPHPGDVLKSTPYVRKSPRSGLNLEGRLRDPLQNKFIYYLLRDLHIESLPAGFSGFPGHRRAPRQKLQKQRTNSIKIVAFRDLQGRLVLKFP